ncbi:hypothetical protein [Aeromonas hydrophila]|uniref:hypothetical protein n=1 Tax=Aeromonas hydrophila TaxID=644 RepID=UPI00235FB679|nr:hypothetical protein [Aeromonas hydrophila]
MEYKDIPIEQMKTDDEFKSKRNQLTIISILLMAMSLSDAQIKEANTFIFKIEFSNTHAFGWLVLLGVIVLTVRYYSFAFKYHRQLKKLWSNDMINDRRVLVIFNDIDGTGTVEARGLFSKLNGDSFVSYLEPSGHVEQNYELTYNTGPFLRRSLSFDVDIGESIHRDFIDLQKFDDHWTRDDFRNLLKIECEYKFDAFFRRSEHLELLLPYMASILAISSFIFKTHIVELLK